MSKNGQCGSSRVCTVMPGVDYSEKTKVSVRVHQGYVLSPLLFILVIEALSHNLNKLRGVP